MRPGLRQAMAFCEGRDIEQSQNSRQLIIDMLSKMILHPGVGGPEIMELSRFWHPQNELVWPGWYWHGTGH